MMLLVCIRPLSKKVPINYILLAIFTASEMYMLGVTCSYYAGQTVLAAMGMTCGIVVTLTVYAFWTKRDFTYMGGMLFSLVGILLVLGLFSLIFNDVDWLFYLYSSLCLLVFSLYLIYDT